MKKKESTLLFIAGLLLTWSSAVNAQQTYNLAQCTEIALNQSLQLKADAIDLEKTNASVQQAFSSVLPSVSISGSYQYSPQVQANIIPASVFGGPDGVYSAARMGVAQTKSATAELTQVIYNQSAFIALKSAKVMVAGNQLQIRSSQEDLVYNVAATFYNIQSLQKRKALNEQQLKNTESLLQSTTDQFKAGMATQTDVDRLTVSRDNAIANIAGLTNDLRKYYNLLKTLMNIPLEQSIEVEPFDENAVSVLSPDTRDSKTRTNYLQLEYRKSIAELEYKNIRAGYLPTLSFYANYGYNGAYSDANPFKLINDRFYPSSSLGVRLKIPVFDGFSIKYQAQQKSLEIQKIEIQEAQIIQQNEKDVADAMADYQSNMLTYENQRRNLELAQKVMMDMNQQYESGLVDVTDLINTSGDLQTAQNNYVSALINMKQAELNLLKAQGNLLP